MSNKVYYLPFYFSLVIALIILFFYLYSGQSQIDQGLSQLNFQPGVKQVANQNGEILITCDDGSQYQFVATGQELNYEAIKADKCQ